MKPPSKVEGRQACSEGMVGLAVAVVMNAVKVVSSSAGVNCRDKAQRSFLARL